MNNLAMRTAPGRFETFQFPTQPRGLAFGLDETDQLSEPLISELPLTHATSWDCFLGILRDGCLHPSLCSVFAEPLVYCFLGTVAKRASKQDAPWGRRSPPVIFVLHPNVARCAVRCYPFDTGAMAAGRLGLRSAMKEDFRLACRLPGHLTRSPGAAVAALYGTSTCYLNGRLRSRPDAPRTLLSEIHAVLHGSHDSREVDHRRFSLELQFERPIHLEGSLAGVLVPARFARFARQLPSRTRERICLYDGAPPRAIRAAFRRREAVDAS